ncbi:MAG: hypothetical protein K2J20_02775 [Bacilli bacterium]|nr:hypothetical protein [Bacilli bacterium]
MAEEKKTTTKSTTKKSAPKTATKSSTTTRKKTTEEVKVEKKFCTNCGKELNGGEVCECCTKKANEASTGAVINSEALMNTGKNIWDTIINVFKKPSTTVKEEMEAKDCNKSIILLVLLAIAFAFYLMAVVRASVSAAIEGINSATAGLVNVGTYADVSYFKVFIYGIIIYALMAIIPMVATIIVAKLTRNNGYNFKKAFNLYITSSAPLILAFLGEAVILLINVSLLNVLGFIAFAIVSLFCFFNFILGFNGEMEVGENRRSYALTSVVIIWVIIEVVALVVVCGSVLNYVYGKVNTPATGTNYNDLFNW